MNEGGGDSINSNPRSIIDRLKIAKIDKWRAEDKLKKSEGKAKKLQAETVALKEKAETDGLTGFLRKEIFVERLDKVLEGKRESDDGKIISVLVIDIDHFKSINDTAGHLKGDEILQKLATEIKGHIRGSDFIGRIGGEEFAICLTGEKGNGDRKAEEIRRKIESSLIRPDGTPLTVSIGVAETTGLRGRQRLIKKADDALYIAKRNGRNRREIDGWPSEIKQAA